MFAPDWDAACLGCTADIDEMSDGLLRHLRSRDTAFALVSRGPLDKLRKYQAARDWSRWKELTFRVGCASRQGIPSDRGP